MDPIKVKGAEQIEEKKSRRSLAHIYYHISQRKENSSTSSSDLVVVILIQPLAARYLTRPRSGALVDRLDSDV